MSLQSDYARRNDVSVAALASLGFLTSITLSREPTRQWRLTAAGLQYVEGLE